MRMGQGEAVVTMELLGKAVHEGDFVTLSRPLHFYFFIFFRFLFIFFKIFIYLFFISWRLITLQYCSGFCHTLT